ncbi:MAG: AAA family ATPase [bacterium]
MKDLTSPTLNASSPAMAGEIMQRIKTELRKAVIGQDSVIDQVLIGLMAGGHVLIEGVPGLGKTLLVRALAKTFDGQYSRIQFTPDLMPSDVSGHVIYDMNSGQFTVRKGPVFTHLLLADEINRAPAKTQAALLEVMQEYQVTLEGKAMKVPRPFMTLATQNPLEQEGTYPLPEAQLDRFLLKIQMDYPSAAEEQAMVKIITDGYSSDTLDVSSLNRVVRAETLSLVQKMTANLAADSAVIKYAVSIARSTREWPGITIGSGPRASIAMVRAAQAHAILNGRDFVSPQDIKAVALPCLRHRIQLAPELELEGQTIDHLLKNMLERIKAPRR